MSRNVVSEAVDGCCLPAVEAELREVVAWNDLSDDGPNFFHVSTEILVPNPGVDPLLVTANPQGMNPDRLVIDVYLRQQQGTWPQIPVWRQVTFKKKVFDPFHEAEIRCSEDPIARVAVWDLV